MPKDVITAREKMALKILKVMFLVVAPYRDYDHKNKTAMEDLFDD